MPGWKSKGGFRAGRRRIRSAWQSSIARERNQPARCPGKEFLKEITQGNNHKRREQPMYEKPELTLVGDARDTILGVVSGGYDIDGNWVWIRNDDEIETLPE